MLDYKDSKIYKIISKSTDKIYIGYSTVLDVVPYHYDTGC